MSIKYHEYEKYNMNMNIKSINIKNINMNMNERLLLHISNHIRETNKVMYDPKSFERSCPKCALIEFEQLC